MTANTIIMDSSLRQKAYVDAQKEKGGGLGIVFADAFVRGMREIGYKNPAWALAELIDNAIQAAATVVEVRFGFHPQNKSRAKPDHLAVVDNGNGMIPEMISYAVRWGGTDRENERKGFGRFGYGLPSSCVSIARRYSVYSKESGEEWHKVTIDLEELAAVASDLEATETMLTAVKEKPPSWLVEASGQLDVATLESGTVIVLEDIDRLRRTNGWIKASVLDTKLLQHFGVIYRHWLGERKIVVAGKVVDPVDPLFLLENARWVKDSPVKPIKQEPHAFTMTADDGNKGTVRIRASVLPPNFQLDDPSQYGKKGARRHKGRFDVMKEYNGLLVCREGRQIDTVRPEWTTFQVYDRNIKIEIDFDPELDDFFGITTSKQQIEIDEKMWEKLKQKGRESGGLIDLVTDMRGELDRLREKLEAEYQNTGGEEQPDPDDLRPSEEAMAEAAKFKTRRTDLTKDQVKEAEENIEQEADRVSRETGKPKEEVRSQLEERTKEQGWHLEFKAIEEGPFFVPRRMGQQRWVIINTAHPFYEKIYSQAPKVRFALEVVLFVLADSELDAQGDREQFYRSERNHWSELMRHGLDALLDDTELLNSAAWNAEIAESSSPQ